jgi:predicted enzyme related to lactoylglutathione lyase
VGAERRCRLIGSVDSFNRGREVRGRRQATCEGPRRRTGGSTWIADADAAAARASELGGSVVAGPEDAGPFREAVLADPAGATFSVSQLTAGP